MGPVRNSPEGMTTLPPPAALQAAMAFAIGSVLSVPVFATAPNCITLKSREGNFGGLIRSSIAGTSDQGSFPGAAAAMRPAPDIRKNSRRDKVVLPVGMDVNE